MIDEKSIILKDRRTLNINQNRFCQTGVDFWTLGQTRFIPELPSELDPKPHLNKSCYYKQMRPLKNYNMDVMQRSHTAKLEKYCHNIFTVARSVRLFKSIVAPAMHWICHIHFVRYTHRNKAAILRSCEIETLRAGRSDSINHQSTIQRGIGYEKGNA